MKNCEICRVGFNPHDEMKHFLRVPDRSKPQMLLSSCPTKYLAPINDLWNHGNRLPIVSICNKCIADIKELT